MENKPRKLIKMKVIFVDQKKKDGTTFKVMKTIINDNGKGNENNNALLNEKDEE